MLYHPVPVMFVPETPSGISTSFTSTLITPCIGPMPSSTSIRVRLPSLRAKTTGGVYQAVPYNIGTKSLYRAWLTATADVLQSFPYARTGIAGGTNSIPPNRFHMPRARQSPRVYPQEVNGSFPFKVPQPPATSGEYPHR